MKRYVLGCLAAFAALFVIVSWYREPPLVIDGHLTHAAVSPCPRSPAPFVVGPRSKYDYRMGVRGGGIA